MDPSKERALKILTAAYTKNALQPVLLHVSDFSSYTDYILVLSAKSVRQVVAISEAIQKEMNGLRSREVSCDPSPGEHSFTDGHDINLRSGKCDQVGVGVS